MTPRRTTLTTRQPVVETKILTGRSPTTDQAENRKLLENLETQSQKGQNVVENHLLFSIELEPNF